MCNFYSNIKKKSEFYSVNIFFSKTQNFFLKKGFISNAPSQGKALLFIPSLNN